MEHPAEAAPADESRPPRPLLVWAAVFASMLLYSGIRAPVPGVNEPHYLAKAKHFWNPDWCAGDFFLESSNTHLVFYQSVGFFTQFLTLAQTAWLGRLAALAILARGWVRFVGRIVPGSWTSLWAVWMYLAIAAVGNLSGEWIVGGVEGKVFAYGFGFWALAAGIDRQWIKSALLAGLGVSFHPVVGGWIVICALAGIAATQFFRRQSPDGPAEESLELTVPVGVLACGIFLLACLPGVWPALQLLDSGDASQADRVIQIQVFDRIRHHMDPMTFSHSQYAAYGLMVVVWLLARHRLNWGRPERWFAWFVGTSIVIALGGIALGFGERPIESPEEITWRYRLLKFYPFRLADVLVPLAVSLTVSGLFAQALNNNRNLDHWQRSSRDVGVRCWLLFASLFVFSLAAPAIDRNPSRMDEEHLSDWRAACEWINEETPTETMVWTPINSWAFKWYAQRAEYIARKDCPQDPAGIIEWDRRMQIQKQRQLSKAFYEEPNLDYAILRKGRGTLPIDPVYENDHYRIYDLTVFSRRAESRERPGD